MRFPSIFLQTNRIRHFSCMLLKKISLMGRKGIYNMKQKFIRVAACVLLVTFVLPLAACSSNKAPGAPSSSAAENASSAPENSGSEPTSSASAGGLNANGKYDTVEDFVNSDLMQGQLETMKSQLGDISKVTGEGNKMIFTVTYDLGDQDQAVVSAAMDTMAPAFEAMAGSLKEAVEAEDPVIVVTYMTKDGTELYSREFSAK